MFNKKIILLISFLLVICSSYIIFHRKKDNNDEVNLVDNSDSSINEEGSINENTESSSSLLFVIIIIVIIIIVIAIVFFIFYRKIKEANLSPEELFEEYKKFKEIEANKVKIEKVKGDLDSKVIVKSIIELFEQNALNYFISKENIDNYLSNKFLIDFYYPFANNDVVPYQENNKIIYRFNIKNHKNLLNEILSNLFGAVDNYELFANDNFNSKNKNEQKDILYIFMAAIVEPFLEAIRKQEFDNKLNTFIFVKQNDNDQKTFKKFILDLVGLMSLGEPKKTGLFIVYAAKNNFFSSIFSQLIKEYFPFNFVFEKNKAIENK